MNIVFKKVYEEGFKAAREGANSWDNPYDYQYDSVQAYAWDEGFKAGSK